MLPRCLLLSTLLLAPSLPVVGSPNVVHFGHNILLPVEQRFHNASCFLCSTDVEARTTGSVRVFAGNVFLSGAVAGHVVVFGGNVTLANGAKVGGRVVIFGGHLHQDPDAASPAQTVLPPIILFICVLIAGLIFLTRRMVRGPVLFPPLPRL